MSYPELALTGVGIALGGGAAAWWVALRRGGRPSLSPLAVVITVVALFVLTAVFDSIMIAAGFFHYDPDALAGPLIGLAPIEDFAYPLAGALLLPALWGIVARGGADRRAAFAQLVLASRPVSWVNTAFPFGAAYLLTVREIDWVFVVGVLYFLIPYNFAMYGINDVFDYASDLKNPRKGGIEGALLTPTLHRQTIWSAIVSNLPFLVLLGSAGGPAAWLALAVSAFAVVAYSAPGFRFKERPVLDSLTSSTHFVSPAVVGLTLAGAVLTWSLLLVLVAFFLWGMAAHAFGAIQDIRPDRKAKIHSIATAFGARATARFSLVMWALAGLVMLATEWPGPLAAVLAVPYLVNCAPWWNVTDESSSQTNRAWRRFIWLNYISGFFATLILIMEWNLS